MFETREQIFAALMALKFDPDEWGLDDEPARTGIVARILGPGAKPINPPPPRGFPEDAAKAYAALARPAVRLQSTSRAKLKPGTSKIGGAPDLAPGMDWPMRPALPERAKIHAEGSGITAEGVDLSFLDHIKDENGKAVSDYVTPELTNMLTESWNRIDPELAAFYSVPGPLPFLAQINFAELEDAGALSELPDMPKFGVLSLFYDLLEQPWGFDPKDAGQFKLVWQEGNVSALQQTEPPQILQDLAKREDTPAIVKQRRLNPVAAYAFPDTVDDEIFTVPELNEHVHDAMFDWLDDWHDLLEPDHRVGGWPNVVQNPMETQCALVTAGKYCGDGDAYEDPANAGIIATSPDWTLLLQIDSDEKAGFMFGDCGRLYVWIRTEDLRARAFEKAWVIVQCY